MFTLHAKYLCLSWANTHIGTMVITNCNPFNLHPNFINTMCIINQPISKIKFDIFWGINWPLKGFIPYGESISVVVGSPIWPKFIDHYKIVVESTKLFNLHTSRIKSIWKRNNTSGLCWTANKYIYFTMKGIENNNHYKVVTKLVKVINLQKYKQNQISLRKNDMDYIIHNWILNKYMYFEMEKIGNNSHYIVVAKLVTIINLHILTRWCQFENISH